MIVDVVIPDEVLEAANKVASYAISQNWSNDWRLMDLCSASYARELEKEVLHWKSNHDNQVALKSTLIQRPDLKDRSQRMQKFINEHQQLKRKVEELIESYSNDVKHFGTDWCFYENESDYDIEEAKMKKLEDVIGDLKNLLK